MTSREFFDLVAELRDKQKDYFRTRALESLDESKRLERQVDNEIYRVKTILNRIRMKNK